MPHSEGVAHMGSKYIDFSELEFSKKPENYGGESTLHRLTDGEHIFKRFRNDLSSSILKSKQRNLDELLDIKELSDISIMPDSMVITWGIKNTKLLGTIMDYKIFDPLSLKNFGYQIGALKEVREILYKFEELNTRHYDLKIDNIIDADGKIMIGDMDSASAIGVKTDYSCYDRLTDYTSKGGTASFNAEIYLYNLMTYELLIKPYNNNKENRLLGYELTHPKIDGFCYSLINEDADQIADHEFLIDYVEDYVKK
jgi:hypothetical protein